RPAQQCATCDPPSTVGGSTTNARPDRLLQSSAQKINLLESKLNKQRASTDRKRMSSWSFLPPCVPVLRRAPPDGEGCFHQVKSDGWQLQVHKSGRDVALFTRKRPRLHGPPG